MMKSKLSMIILLVFIVSIVIACQKATNGTDLGTMKKTETSISGGSAGANAAVDSVGNDLNTANADEKDLGTDNLSDVDSGLNEVQNI